MKFTQSSTHFSHLIEVQDRVWNKIEYSEAVHIFIKASNMFREVKGHLNNHLYYHMPAVVAGGIIQSGHKIIQDAGESVVSFLFSVI